MRPRGSRTPWDYSCRLDQPDEQLDRVLDGETALTHERLPGLEVERMFERGDQEPSAFPAPAPARCKHVSHLTPFCEIGRVQSGERGHAREVAQEEKEGVADAAVVLVKLGEGAPEGLLML